jgi:probable phosphoglycerate mutase
MDTARIVTKGWTTRPIAVDGLREISHGHWEGLRRKDVEERFAAEYAMWEQDPFTYAPSGGKSGLAVLARALPALRAIIAGLGRDIIGAVEIQNSEF